MKSILGKFVLSLMLAFIFIALITYPLSGYNNGRDTKVSENSIGKVEIETKDRQIFLNIHLNKPVSCIQAIKVLKISDLSINGKIYIPICSMINYHLLRIKYEEAISI